MLNLVSRVHFSFGQHQEHEFRPLPRKEVRKSRTSGSSTHAQKFETTAVVNGYKNGPSLRLRINWKWPESAFLVLTERKADSGDEIVPCYALWLIHLILCFNWPKDFFYFGLRDENFFKSWVYLHLHLWAEPFSIHENVAQILCTNHVSQGSLSQQFGRARGIRHVRHRHSCILDSKIYHCINSDSNTVTC